MNKELIFKRKSRIKDRSVKQISRTSRAYIKTFFPKDFYFDVNDAISMIPFTHEELFSRSRDTNLVQWRYVLALWYFMSGETLEATAEIIEKDHATVLHGIRNCASALEGFNHELKMKINDVMNISEVHIMSTRDTCVNEAISLVYIESQLLNNFPNLVKSEVSYSHLFG